MIFPDSGGSIGGTSFKVVLGGDTGDYPLIDMYRELVFEDDSSELVVWGDGSSGRTSVNAEFTIAQIPQATYNELMTYLNTNKGSKIKITLEDGEEVFGPLYPPTGTTAYVIPIEVDPKGEGEFSSSRSIFEIRLKLSYTGTTANAELNTIGTAKYDILIKVITNSRGGDYIAEDETARLALSPSINEFCFQQDNRTVYYWSGAIWSAATSTALNPNPVPSYIPIILNNDDIGLNDGDFYFSSFTDLAINYTIGNPSPPAYKSGFINRKTIKFPGWNIDIEKGPAIERPEGFSFSLNNVDRFHIDTIDNTHPFFGADVELYQYDKANAKTVLIRKGINIENIISVTDYRFKVEPKYLFSQKSFPVTSLTKDTFPGVEENEGDKIIQTYGRWDFGNVQELANKSDAVEMSRNISYATIINITTDTISGDVYQVITLSVNPDEWLLTNEINLPILPTLTTDNEYFCLLSNSESSEQGKAKAIKAYRKDTITISDFITLVIDKDNPFKVKTNLTIGYLVDGASQTGNFLTVDTGSPAVQVGEKFLIDGDATEYAVTEVNSLVWTVDPEISTPPANGAAITLLDLVSDGDVIQLFRMGIGFAIDSERCIGFQEAGYLTHIINFSWFNTTIQSAFIKLFIEDEEGNLVKLPSGLFRERDGNKNIIEFSPENFDIDDDGAIKTNVRFDLSFIEPQFTLTRIASIKFWYLNKDMYKALWTVANSNWYGSNTIYDLNQTGLSNLVVTGWPALIHDSYPTGKANPRWAPRATYFPSSQSWDENTFPSMNSSQASNVYRSNIWQYFDADNDSGVGNSVYFFDTQIDSALILTILVGGVYRFLARNRIQFGFRSGLTSSSTDVIATETLLLQFGWSVSTDTKQSLRNATGVKLLTAFQVEWGNHDNEQDPTASADWVSDGAQSSIFELLDIKDGTTAPAGGDLLALDTFTAIFRGQCGFNEWLVDGGSQTGTTLNTKTGANLPPVNARFTIAGVSGVYTITGSTSTSFSFTPALASSPADNAIFSARTWQIAITGGVPNCGDGETVVFDDELIDFSDQKLKVRIVGSTPTGTRTLLAERTLLNKNYDKGTDYKDYYVFNNIPTALGGNDSDYNAAVRKDGNDEYVPIQVSGSGNDGYLFNSGKFFALDDSVFANDGAIFNSFSNIFIEIVNASTLGRDNFSGTTFNEKTKAYFGWGSITVDDRKSTTPTVDNAFLEFEDSFDLLNKPAFARIDGGKIINGGSTLAENPIEIIQDVLRQAPLIPDSTNVTFPDDSEQNGRDLWKWRAQFEQEKDVKQIILEIAKQMHAFILIDENGDLKLRSLDEDDHGLPIFNFDETNVIKNSISNIKMRDGRSIYQGLKLRYHYDVRKKESSREISISVDDAGDFKATGLNSFNQQAGLSAGFKDRISLSKALYSNGDDNILEFDASYFYQGNLQNVDNAGQPFNGVYKLVRKLLKFHTLNTWTLSFKANQKYFVYDSGVTGGRIKLGDLITFKHWFWTNDLVMRGIVTKLTPNPYDGYYTVQIFSQTPPDSFGGFHDLMWDGGEGEINILDYKFKGENYGLKDTPISGEYPDGGTGDISSDRADYQFDNDDFADSDQTYPL